MEVMPMANKLYKPILIDSIEAACNIEYHRFIGFDGNYCSAGAKALGISDVSIERGQQVPVGVLGIFLVETAEDVTAGDKITSDGNGKAVVVSDTEAINGYSLDTAESGDLIRVIRGI